MGRLREPSVPWTHVPAAWQKRPARGYHWPSWKSNTRRIIHVDMDCFYAAVEERERPELRGRPLGVVGSRARRGVLTTCNYEARKYGIRSAMPDVHGAWNAARNSCSCPPRFDLYRAESARVRAIFLEYTPLVEPLSLDEAYLDVSALPRPATDIAREIRARIFDATA